MLNETFSVIFKHCDMAFLESYRFLKEAMKPYQLLRLFPFLSCSEFGNKILVKNMR